MDLPTYTNIWRIEKRLYKLYDLRLPMPLPIVWIGVFVGVLVPWCVFLALVGLPFAPPWHVVYLVPPGVLTWLSTRPVIEGKRLTELLQSQFRYLTEPRTWCRMAPLSEPDEIVFTARVWRAAPRRAVPARPSSVKAGRTAAARAAASPNVRPVEEAATGKGRVSRPERVRLASWRDRGTRLVRPSRVVRPAVAAAAAAAAPIADAPPAGSGPDERDRRKVEGTRSWGTASARPWGAPPADGKQAVRARPGPPPALPGSPTGEHAAPPTGGDRAAGAAEPAVAQAERVVPPIGAEALRRLRRLAASAEQRTEDAGGPAAAGGAEPRAADATAAPNGSRETEPPAAAAGSPDGEATRQARDQSNVVPWRSPRGDRGRRPGGAPDRRGEARNRDEQAPTAPARDARARGTRAVPPAPPAAAMAEQGRPAAGRGDGEPAPAAATGAVDSAPHVSLVPQVRPAGEEPRLRRVEAVVGRDPSGGWRRLAQVVVGGGRTHGMEIDEGRARMPLATSRRIMVLGCTGGAGQTTTALMLGHTLARYREDRVLALDAGAGEETLTSRVAAQSPETLTSLLAGVDELTGYLGVRAYTTRCESGLEVVGTDGDEQTPQRLADRAFLADWGKTLAALDRHYRLTVIDPAAALAARLLPYTDQLVLVAPASEDAPDGVAMTYEWLDGHGCSHLRRRAVMVINGVSRRSLPDVEQAEAVASGRCRAIVRVPWEDELAPGRPGPVDVNHLRAGGRRAYVALAGVIVSGLAAVEAKQEVAR